MTLLQKQVGQTIVQLAQDRQRSAIWAHRGLSNWASSRSCRPAIGTGSPIAAATSSTASVAVDTWMGSAARTGSRATRSPPSGVPTRTTNPSSSSVRARS